jgi:hypothetical protein
VKEGPLAGLRVLGVEEECGRSLVKALTAEQFAKAKFSDEAPKEMLTAAEKVVKPLDPAGLSEAEMTVGQRAMLHRLVREYLDRLNGEKILYCFTLDPLGLDENDFDFYETDFEEDLYKCTPELSEEKLRKEFDELPLKYKKIVRTVDIAVLLVVVAAFVYPFM